MTEEYMDNWIKHLISKVPVFMKITVEEFRHMKEEDKKEYINAANCINDDWALGPFGGWERAHNSLLKIGWIKEEKTVGFRIYRKMIRSYQNV